jgi:hypothetical protein
MGARRMLDRCPGALPEIHAEGDSVTFAFDLHDVPAWRLIVRCDANGDVFASILDLVPPPSPYPFTAGE